MANANKHKIQDIAKFISPFQSDNRIMLNEHWCWNGMNGKEKGLK